MLKRGLKRFRIFLNVLVILSINVLAQGKITDTLQGIGEFIFHDLGAMGAYGFKFLMWIALFSLFEYGLTKAKFDKKVSGILAFTVSLAAVIIIPGPAIIQIFELYSFILILSLGLIVPLILFWAIHRSFQGEGLGEMMIRAALYFIMSAALFWFTANVNTLIGGLG